MLKFSWTELLYIFRMNMYFIHFIMCKLIVLRRKKLINFYNWPTHKLELIIKIETEITNEIFFVFSCIEKSMRSKLAVVAVDVCVLCAVYAPRHYKPTNDILENQFASRRCT